MLWTRRAAARVSTCDDLWIMVLERSRGEVVVALCRSRFEKHERTLAATAIRQVDSTDEQPGASPVSQHKAVTVAPPPAETQDAMERG